MKKILNALFLTLLAVFTFSSCSDVPAPYDILGEGDVPGLPGRWIWQSLISATCKLK